MHNQISINFPLSMCSIISAAIPSLYVYSRPKAQHTVTFQLHSLISLVLWSVQVLIKTEADHRDLTHQSRDKSCIQTTITKLKTSTGLPWTNIFSLLPFYIQKLVRQPKNLMIVNRKVSFSILFQCIYCTGVRSRHRQLFI